MARVGRVVTKRQIVNSLSAWDADFSENAVEVYVYRLRKRLEAPAPASRRCVVSAICWMSSGLTAVCGRPRRPRPSLRLP